MGRKPAHSSGPGRGRRRFGPGLLAVCLGLSGALILAADAPAAPKRRSRTRTTAPAKKPPVLPPAAPAAKGIVPIGPADSVVRSRITELEQALKESRAREEQTAAKLDELMLLLGRSAASPNAPVARLANLVGLYHRLQAIEEEMGRLRPGVRDDQTRIEELKREQESIFDWFRASLGDPGRVVMAAPIQTGPTRQELAAVEVATAEVRSTEQHVRRIEHLVTQGLLPRSQLLRAQQELAQVRLRLARAEARVRGDGDAERRAARAALEAAEADYNLANGELVQLLNLQRAGAVATLEVSNAQSRLRKARSAVDAARGEIKRLEGETTVETAGP